MIVSFTTVTLIGVFSIVASRKSAVTTTSSIADATKAAKVRLYADLVNVATVDEINAIMTEPDAPAYTVDSHDAVVGYVKRVISERARK